jgi:hypothetical protein
MILFQGIEALEDYIDPQPQPEKVPDAALTADPLLPPPLPDQPAAAVAAAAAAPAAAAEENIPKPMICKGKTCRPYDPTKDRVSGFASIYSLAFI